MRPEDVARRIEELVAEEHAIERREEDDGPSQEDRERLKVIRIALDELWDLRRRQHARAASGQDPTVVELQDAARVEGYRQ